MQRRLMEDDQWVVPHNLYLPKEVIEFHMSCCFCWVARARSNVYSRSRAPRYLTMFSPASVNVLCFDPQRGCDQARGYATKYASKPEKWFTDADTANAYTVVATAATAITTIVAVRHATHHRICAARAACKVPHGEREGRWPD